MYLQQEDEGGWVMTYTQPPVVSGDVTSMSYQPHMPASLGCQMFESRELYPTAMTSGVEGRSTSVSKPGGLGGDGWGGKAGTRAVAALFTLQTSGAVQILLVLLGLWPCWCNDLVYS